VIVAATEIDPRPGRLSTSRAGLDSGLIPGRTPSVVSVGICSQRKPGPAGPLRRRLALVKQGTVQFEAGAATLPLRRRPALLTQRTVWLEAEAMMPLRSMPVVSKGVTLRPEAAPVPLRLSPVIAVFAAAAWVPSRFKPGVRVIPPQHSAQVILSYLSGRGTPRIRTTLKHVAELLVGRPLWP
jgi:hypothetical protein